MSDDPKYNVVISRGCTAFYTSINDKIVGCEHEPSRLTESETDEFVEYILNKIREAVKNNEISLDSLIELFHYSYEEYDDGVCDSCGDSVNRTIYEL